MSDQKSPGPQKDKVILIQQLVDALLDDARPLHPRFLYRMSDLEGNELRHLENVWSRIPLVRRRALFEDLYLLAENDYLLSFEGISRLALQDSDGLVRFGGVRTLIACECERRDLVAIFLDLAEDDPDGDVRAIAASALGRFVYLGEIEELPKLVQDDLETRLLQLARRDQDAHVRRNAIEALGFSSREEINALILDAYQSTDPAWIASALFAMGRSADEKWHRQVLEKLDHVSPAVRTEASRAAGELSLSAARGRMIDLANDDDEDVCKAAIWSLSQIGGKGVQEFLTRRLKKARYSEDIKFLEEALDNLAFTSDLENFGIFYIPTVADGAEVDEDAWESESIDVDQVDDELIAEALLYGDVDLDEFDYEEEDDLDDDHDGGDI